MSNNSVGLTTNMYELRQRAEEYYKENGVPEKMEDLLNTMFIDQPPDVYGHISEFFRDFARDPYITKLKCRKAYDSNGHQTTQTEVHCMVRNKEKLICTCLSSGYMYSVAETSRAEEKEAEEMEQCESVRTAIELINTEICQSLQDQDPSAQDLIDSISYDLLVKLKEMKEVSQFLDKENVPDDDETNEKLPDNPSPGKQKRNATPKGKGKMPQAIIIPNEPQEKLVSGSSSVSAVSRAVCTAAALIKHIPIYEYIASLMHSEVPDKFCLPQLLVTILQNGKFAPGKLNCVKEFIVIPVPGMRIHEAIDKILQIYHQVAKMLVSKGGSKKGPVDYTTAKNVTEIGALCPSLDKPEQGIDMLIDAMTALDLKPGEDFNIGLKVAGHEMFDLDKGKYEVMTGQFKSPEDLVDFWVELLGRYPSINVLIDPMRKEDRVNWLRLCDKLTDRCYMIGEYGYHRPGLLINENLEEVYREYKTNAIILRLEQMNTITQIIKVINKMKEADNEIVIATCHGETTESFISDFAVGLGVKFLKVGAPGRGERISKLNRLLQIEDELEDKSKLTFHTEYVYNHIEMPPSPEPEETRENSPSNLKKDAKKK